MNKNNDNIIIQNEKKDEQFAVENLVRESFWNVYRPGCLEHFVLNQMRKDENFVKELNFVIKLNGKIIGQNVFYKTFITLENGEKFPILTMGPICIANEYKRKGYGKMLLDYSLKKATEMGFGAVCFEGNIDFYSKSGFTFARNFNIRYLGLPEGADDSFFLCKELKKGYLDNIKGEYQTPNVYLVDEDKAEEFDKQFPYKEKKKLDSQIF
ncbi:MAG: N-acetyltransferase [Clostridia bacterium]|nr:N-acetyltransferase [Clostridia bacterium]